ncbi:MAG TPA: MarR family transcriptional regulator [Clostridia bacterium]|nr:MarR family transcriptional regulator [Clostridia bacterium]
MNTENVSRKLFEQFRQCAVLFQRGMHRHPHPPFREVAIKRSQARLLDILLEEDGQSLKDIVERMDIRPSSAGELVGKLEQSGLVERRENPTDKRVVNVFLTEAGRKEAERNAEERVDRDLFSGLDEQEQEQLSGLMEKLIASLKARFDQPGAWGLYRDREEGCRSMGPHGRPGPWPPHGGPGPCPPHGFHGPCDGLGPRHPRGREMFWGPEGPRAPREGLEPEREDEPDSEE